MGLAQAEDCIARQGTDGLRLWIDLTDIINDQGMKIATLEHAVQELRHLLPKSDMPKELVEMRTTREFCKTYILSVPVLVDTPGLACFDDFANALCSGNADLFDWMSMSLSSWSQAHEDLAELRLKRPIKYINGVFGASSLDCNRIRQAVEHAWKGAVLPKTDIAELVYGTGSITADHGEVAGFLQRTSYGIVWADLIAEAEDSGFLHPDGYNGQRFTESWRPNGYSLTEWQGRWVTAKEVWVSNVRDQSTIENCLQTSKGFSNFRVLLIPFESKLLIKWYKLKLLQGLAWWLHFASCKKVLKFIALGTFDRWVLLIPSKLLSKSSSGVV